MNAEKLVSTAADRVASGLGGLLGSVSAAEVFSPPTTVGDTTVITAAVVETAGGFGFGGGAGVDADGGGGGGGGGSTQGRPVAVIEVSPAGVRVRPILDLTRIGIAVIATLVAMRRRRR